MSKSSHYQKAKSRAAWIWQRHNEKGYVTSAEIRREFGRPGRGLDKEIMRYGLKLPPILSEQERLAHEQSQVLMEASNGKPMTTKQMAKALDCHQTSVKAIRKKLVERGLPCPELMSAYEYKKQNGLRATDKTDMEICGDLPDQLSTRYPSHLQAMSWRYIEMENGEIKIAYLLR